MSPTELPDAPAERPLSAKSRRFAEEYAWSEDLNATKAALRAGYKESAARRTASDLLQDSRVKAAIAEQLQLRSEQTRVKAALALEECALVMRSSIDHYTVTPDGEITAKSDAPDGAIRAIASVKRKERQFINSQGRQIRQIQVEYRLHDKNAQITNALKHLGLMKEKVEHSGPNGAPIAHALTSITVRFVKPNEVPK